MSSLPTMGDDHPLPWLAPLLNGIEQASPIILSLSKDETRAIEYSKAATRGNWNDVWSSFDQRRNAKKGEQANDAGDEGPGLFGDEGEAGGAVAAE